MQKKPQILFGDGLVRFLLHHRDLSVVLKHRIFNLFDIKNLLLPQRLIQRVQRIADFPHVVFHDFAVLDQDCGRTGNPAAQAAAFEGNEGEQERGSSDDDNRQDKIG
ncbi:hypothetical protein D3C75_978510 [compost metagenome]